MEDVWPSRKSKLDLYNIHIEEKFYKHKKRLARDLSASHLLNQAVIIKSIIKMYGHLMLQNKWHCNKG